VQSKLRDQARSLVNRMRSRELAGAGDAFRSFAESMEKAIAAMGPATEKLGGRQWKDALEPEQKALQGLLRAEATFRDIQVAFGRQGGGGRGGNQGRDLEGLFDLELDTEKNQYETGQQSASDQRQKQVDEAMAKLEQLARRQQELAEQRDRQRLSEQRWQQEMLRREAEQLRREMEQMQRGQQSQQGQQQAQSGQSGRSGQAGGQNSRQLERAISQVDQALREMRRADAGQAARQLRQAQQALDGMQRDQAGRDVQELARQAEQLAAGQRQFNNKLRESVTSGKRGGDQLAREKEELVEGLQRMERDMQRAARGMAATDRETANKLRQALAELQQDEIAGRMKWSAEAIRRGLAMYAVMREAITTQALDNLRQQLQEAERGMQQGQQAGRQPGQQEGGLERALAETQRLRERMEGRGGTGGGEAPRTDPERLERALREGVRGLERLQGSLEGYPEMAGEIGGTLGRVRRVDPKRFPGNPQLLENLHAQVLRQVADVELELRRKLDQGGEVRTTAGEPAPPGYGDAVAEYFRRLSRAGSGR